MRLASESRSRTYNTLHCAVRYIYFSDLLPRPWGRVSLRSLAGQTNGRPMAAPFSLEQIARVRGGARRLATNAARHEGEVRKLLATTEASFEQARTAWSGHDAS